MLRRLASKGRAYFEDYRLNSLNDRYTRYNNKMVRINSISGTSNNKFEIQSLIILATLAIISTQIFIYFCYKSSPLWCNGVDLRFSRLQAQSDYLPIIYVITPTYERFVQKAELTRLSHTFLLVPNIHWILVEDSKSLTDVVTKFVFRMKNEFQFQTITHLHKPTPDKYKLRDGDPNWLQPKGVWQRNAGLDWIRDNLDDFIDKNGVIYFADDDNTYDLQLFNEMRYTTTVSVWPVGLVGGLLVERPVVSGKKVVAFNSRWKNKRYFPLDMAGFAVSVKLFATKQNVSFPQNGPRGYLESYFLDQFVKSWDELEPRADKCTRVYVWHTRSEKPNLNEEQKLRIPSTDGIVW